MIATNSARSLISGKIDHHLFTGTVDETHRRVRDGKNRFKPLAVCSIRHRSNVGGFGNIALMQIGPLVAALEINNIARPVGLEKHCCLRSGLADERDDFGIGHVGDGGSHQRSAIEQLSVAADRCRRIAALLADNAVALLGVRCDVAQRTAHLLYVHV
jgi:hypothetical protein